MFKRKKRKTYDFKYTIFWKNGAKTIGEVTGSDITPTDLFLTKRVTYYSSNKAYYYNSDEINQIEITDLVEKVD